MGKKAESALIRQDTKSARLDETARAFLSERRARLLSGRTIDFYSYHLDILQSYCEGRGAAGMADLSPDLVRSLLDDWSREHNAGGVHALYRCVKAFCNWFEKEDDGDWRNPMRKVTGPKLHLDPIPGVSTEDVERLVAGCGRSWYGRRDRALLLFLFDTGVRVSECCALNLEHVDLTAKTVRVVAGKGGKNRTVFFGDNTGAELRRYLRGRSTDSPDDPLWLNRWGERMDFVCLRDMLTRRARASGMEEIPSAHDFRRGFALNMLRNGTDLLTVSRLLGHESLEVTKKYLALVQEDLERGHRIGSPVDNMLHKR